MAPCRPYRAPACGFQSCLLSQPLCMGVKNSLPRHTDILCLAMLSWPICARVYFSHKFPELQGLAEGAGTLRDCWPYILVSRGCCNRFPQSGRWGEEESLIKTEIYSLCLEARSLISRCQQAHTPLKPLGECFMPDSRVAEGNPWCFLSCGCVTPSSASIITK